MRPNVQIILDELRSKNSDILTKFDPDRFIALFDREAADKHYSFVPAEVRDGWNAVISAFGESGFEALQRMTMLRLIHEAARSKRRGSASACFRSSAPTTTLMTTSASERADISA